MKEQDVFHESIEILTSIDAEFKVIFSNQEECISPKILKIKHCNVEDIAKKNPYFFKANNRN